MVKKALERYKDESSSDDGQFVVFGGRYWGMGSAKYFKDETLKYKIEGTEMKVIKSEAVAIKKPDIDVKYSDYFEYGGYAFLMSPLLALDLLAPIKKVYILEYVLEKNSYETGDHDFDGIYETEEERLFFEDKTIRTLFIEDCNGDCLNIASCGLAEKRKQFVEGFEVKYKLEGFIIKTSDPFGEF